MKKKLFVLIGTLGLMLGLQANGMDGRRAPVNPDFTAWQTKTIAARANATAAASAGRSSTVTGLRPAPFDARYLVDLKKKRALKTSTAAESKGSLPTTYDLRDKGWVTSVKDQNPYGTCWAHGALASMESALLKSEGTTYDFSENNMVNLCGFTFTSMNSKGQPYPWNGENEGGHYLMSLAYLLRWSGPVSETDDPYSSPGNSVAHDAQRHLIGCQWITQRTSDLDNDEIKQAILDHGAVAIDYYHDDAYLKSSSYYCPYAYSGNHLVAVVGWDDNYSKSNFASKPSGNGAFLIKNSWGTSFGSSGYFWVSYYDKTLGYGNPMVSYYNVDASGNYDNIYQYDELGFVGSLWTSEDGVGYGACIFTAKDLENISAVGFYALADTTSYELSVRTGVSATDPSSGTLATTVSGTAPHLGYVVVPLPSAVKVAKGANFAVTMKLTTEDYEYPIAYASVSSDYSESEVISGKCYFSDDGTSWEKTTEEDICLKAYSTVASTSALSSIAISGASNLYGGNTSTYTCTATYSDSSTGAVSPTWTITSGSAYASISSSGVLTANMVSSAQSVTIKASYTSGGVTKTATKTVSITPATTEAASYALIVGINEYTLSGCSTLTGCVPDSRAVKMLCTEYGDWEEDNIVVLNDSDATLVRFRQEIANLAAKAKSGDTVLIYDSGHGGTTYDTSGNPTKSACICSYDAEYSDTLFASDIAKFASGVKLVVMLDTCHSAGMFKNAAQATDAKTSAASFLANFIANVSSEIDGIKTRSNKATAVTIGSSEIGWLAAADYDEYSSDYGVGLFTSIMCVDSGVLQGNADANGDGRVTFYELYQHAVDFKNKYSLDQTAQAANTAVLGSLSVENRNVDIATALDSATLDFDDGTLLGFNGIASWVGECDDGAYAARSVVIPDSKSATLETTVSGAGKVSFSWKVSSESGYDKLKFYVDETLQDSISGEQDWTDVSFEISDDGEHTLKWKYQKDRSSSSGMDCGWISDLAWPGSDPEPDPTVLIEKPVAAALVSYTGANQTGVTSYDSRLSVDGTLVAADAGVCYTATFSLPTDSGTTYTWTDGSTDPVVINWSIESRNINDASVTFAAIGDQLYTGSAITPAVTMTFAGAVRTLGTDYTVSYSDNVGIGTGKATVVGMGNFTGTKDLTFGIVDHFEVPWKDDDVVAQEDTMIVYAVVSNRQTKVGVDAPGSVLAAFATNGELRGIIDGEATTCGWRYQLSVGIASESETEFSFKIWNAATGETTDISETLDCNSEKMIGTLKEPHVFYIGYETCEVTIKEGWTWITPSVVLDDASIGTVFSGLTFAEDDVIKTSGKVATYCDGEWNPSSFKLSPGVAYVVHKSAGGAESVAFTGAPAEPSIGVKAGWNWIGSTSLAETKISAATHSGEFAEDDVVKSISKVSTYCDGEWQPSSFVFTPGIGYKTRLANAGTLTFGSGKSVKSAKDDCEIKSVEVKAGSVRAAAPWTEDDIVTQEDTMTVYLKVSNDVDKVWFDAIGTTVAAFSSSGECRGVLAMDAEAYAGRRVFQLSVGITSVTEEGFTFKVWDAESGSTYNLVGTLNCNSSKQIGKMKEPYIMLANVPIPAKTVITFSANGGVGGPSGSVTATKGKAMPAVSGAPTKTGYAFGGYGDAAKGGVTYYNADLTSAKNWDKDDAKATLYAQWTANTYTVTFHKNDGTAATTTQNFTYDVKQKLAANTFTWVGHDFVGWAETAEGDVLLGDGASVLNLTATANGNVDFYAVWEKRKITIAINGESAQYEYGEEVTLTPPANVVGKHGYTNLVCQGWNGGTGNISATGTGSEVKFTVTQASTLNWLYQTNYWFEVKTEGQGSVSADGSAVGAGSWKAFGATINLAASADVANHYHFAGWKDTETEASIWTADANQSFVLGKPVLITACFALDTFQVKFDLGDYGARSGGGELAQTVEYGKAAAEPTVTAMDGCTFTGWDSDDWKSVTGEVTVKAAYNFKQYAINYEKVHGDNSANPTKYAITNETITFAAPKDIPTGYHFQGWSPASIAKGSTGEKTVTAQWKFDFAVDGGAAAEVASGESVTRTAPGEGTWGETNIVCMGWIGTGDVPATGEKNTVTFTITKPSTLTWLYVTNYMVRVNGGTLADDKKTYELNGDWVSMGTELTAKTELNTTNNYVNLIYRGTYTGTGDVKGGTGRSVVFTVTKPSSVTWNYGTNYCFRVTKEGEGTLAFEKTEFEDEGYWPGGTSVKVTATADTSKHYHFAGWTDALAGASLGTETKKTFVLNAPTLVMAVFALDTFTVRFDAGSKGEITRGNATQNVGYGLSATEPTVTAKPGYRFTGWDRTFSNITDNLTVTAKYETLTYTIAYAETKGCNNANTTSFTVEDVVRFSALTNPPGWKFLGWEPSEIAKGTANNVTVTAQWEHIKYAIAIDGVAGDDRYYGDQATASTFAEKTEGYTNIVCIGWVGTGDIPATGVGTQVTFTVTQESSLTWLYATNYWLEATATGEGSIAVGADGFAAKAKGCWVPAGTNVVLTAVPAEHHHFTGWKDVEDETALSDADEATLSFVMDTPALLEATFAIDTFTVTFDLGEFGVRTGGGELTQTVEYGKGVVAPELSVDAGHTFLRWDRDIDVITDNIVVKAIYDELRFDIIYNDTKDCDNLANPTHYFTTNDLVVFSALTNPPGWKFLGWDPPAIKKGTEGAVTVTAQWEHIKYELNVAGVTSDDHYYGDVITLKQMPQQVSGCTNLVCLGWTGSDDIPTTGVGTQVTFTVTQPSSLQWLYETNYWFEATAAGEGSIAVGADGFAADVAGCWVPAGTNLVVTAVPAEHHHFTGWKDVEDETVLAEADETTLSFVMDTPALLKATFAIDTFEVTFDVGDRGQRTGGGELKQTVEYGKAAVAPTLEVKKGYAFTGWDETFDVVTDDLTVLATYEREVPEIVDPEDIAQGDAPDVKKKAANYVGYLYKADDGTLAGTVKVTAGKGSTDRKTGAYASKISVVIQLANETKKISISGKYDLTNMTAQTFSNNSKPPRSVTLLLGEDGLTGTFEGYTIGGVLKATDSADYQGSYNIFADEGQFVVTIDKKGTAKVAGTTTAGKSVSSSVALLKGEDNACVPVAVPKLNLAFTFWLTVDEMFVEGLTNAEIGAAGTLAEDATFRIDSDELADLIGDETFSAYFPNGLSVAQNAKGKWIVADGAKTGSVVLNRDGTVNETKLGKNPSALKLTYTAKTGTYTGSFKAYYPYQAGARSAVKAKAISFKVKGLLVNGVGYGTASAKIGKETVWIGLEIKK